MSGCRKNKTIKKIIITEMEKHGKKNEILMYYLEHKIMLKLNNHEWEILVNEG